MSVRAFVSRHASLVAAGAVVALGGIIFVLLWFQPQKLILEKTVNEALPSPVAPPPSTAPAGVPRSPASPATVTTAASGTFRSLEHRTTGTAKLLRLANGSLLVRIEDLDTSNGPDLRVYLSEVAPDRGLHDYGREFVDLGALKGNRGDQNYVVPSGIDPGRFKSVVIWCRRFSVGFGVAPLAA